MEKELTKKQKQVLQFIARKIWQEKRPPTIREIAHDFRFSSTGTVRDYLHALQIKGYLRLTQKKSRAIEMVNEKLLEIPIIAQVYAGGPILTDETIQGYVNLERLAFSDEGVFALKVKGESMIEAGIMPEDIVLVRKQAICNNGDIVVAAIEDETTIKYFRRQGNRIYLDPANKAYTPILVKENISIIGKVISVLRNYV